MMPAAAGRIGNYKVPEHCSEGYHVGSVACDAESNVGPKRTRAGEDPSRRGKQACRALCTAERAAELGNCPKHLLPGRRGMLKVKSPQDFGSGLLFIVIGLAG